MEYTGAAIDGIGALRRLRDGNLRFVDGRRGRATGAAARRALVEGQAPVATILGCSDSRVPVEIVFDQGLGDLFVIRVAGNVVAPSQVGSVEFAAGEFGTPLVVVLGHSGCGAVGATIDALRGGAGATSPNLRSIVERVRPSVEPLLQTELADDPAALRRAAVRANVRAAADHLRHGSELLEGLVASGDLLVVGAEYALDSGLVDFFDGVPEGARPAAPGSSPQARHDAEAPDDAEASDDASAPADAPPSPGRTPSDAESP